MEHTGVSPPLAVVSSPFPIPLHSASVLIAASHQT